MGSRSHHRSVVCVCVCAGVCVWVCLIEADSLQLRIIYRGYIRSCHAVLCCQILRLSAVSWSVVFVRSCFRDSWSLPFLDSITGHLAAHCFPALPAPTYGELNLVSSVSPVWRVCNKPFLFPQLESSSLYLWQKDLTTVWIQRRLVVFRNC